MAPHDFGCPRIEIVVTLLRDGRADIISTMAESANDWLAAHKQKLFCELRDANTPPLEDRPMTDREKRLEAALKAAANSLAKGAHDNESGYLRKAEIAARVALCNPHSWGQHGFCVNCNSDRLLIEKTALPTEPAPDAAGVIKRLKGMAAWDHDVGKLSGAVAIAARDALALIGSLEHDLWVASLEQRPTDLARAEATAAKLAAAEAERDRLQKQLPESMQHCTILFKECEKGHGWLTATNWIQHGCPTCERERAVAVTHWAQAVLTALNVGDVCKESPLHLKLREVMIAYREGVPHAD